MKSPQKSSDPITELKKAFWQEVSETKRLARLLKKRSQGKNLSPEEVEAMEIQLMDLGRLIPLITVILLPGGALIIILLERLLPFSILPNAFQKLLRPENSDPSQ